MQTYTAKEVMDLIDHAKAAGIRFVKVPGFEATWDMGQRPVTVEAGAVKSGPKDALGDWVIPLGKKLKGRQLKEVPRKELESFGNYLLKDSDEGNGLSAEAKEFIDKADKYLRTVAK